jgi:putative IMPACT (imprinted ancient) family translation regulator
MTDLDRQLDELEALSYLFEPPQFVQISSNSYQIRYKDPQFDPSNPQYCPLLLTITLPPSYPSKSPPDIDFQYEPYSLKAFPERIALIRWVSKNDQEKFVSFLRNELWQNEEVLWSFHEYIDGNIVYPSSDINHEYQNNHDLNQNDNNIANGGGNAHDKHGGDSGNSGNPGNPGNSEEHVVSSDEATYKDKAESTSHPIHLVGSKPYKSSPLVLPRLDVFQRLKDDYNMTEIDKFVIKKSIFLTWSFPIKNYQTVVEIMTLLYALKEVSTATHSMIVYRYIETSTHPKTGLVSSRVVLGGDEDGEDGAEDVQLNVIKNYDCEALVCCTRIFGGILLGPTRFKVIGDLTRQALDAAGYVRLKK